MTFIFITAILFVIGIALVIFGNDDVNGIWFIGILLTVCCGISLLIIAIAIPMERIETHVFIKQINETRLSYQAARVNGNSIESAAIQVDIARINRALAKKKYLNKNYLDLWYPDVIDDIKPVR